MNISVVIPCYNEAKSIRRVLETIPRGMREVIVVDNNSTDDTPAIARNLGARVVHESRRGYGSALKAGFQNATGDAIAAIDGDGEHPAEKIAEMAALLDTEGFDFISGNRFPLEDRHSMQPVRFIGNKFFAAFMRLVFGLRLKDPWCGMYVFRASLLSGMTLERDDVAICPEMKVRVAANPRLRWREYHIPFYPRVGTSKLAPFRHGMQALLFLLKLKYQMLRRPPRPRPATPHPS